MSSVSDWRSSLSASDRYENIQNISKAIVAANLSKTPSHQNAFSIENEAYKTSTSLVTSSSIDQYNAACQIISPQETSVSSERPEVLTDKSVTQSTGISIGSYRNCHFISSGVTADVYRAETRALKVITETRNIDPHDPFREARILEELRKPCIPLLGTFRDQEQRFVLVFPYMPLTLETLLERGPLLKTQIRKSFVDLFSALKYIHSKGIIHRDVKPSAVLLESPNGPAYLSDFGAAWHPTLSVVTEPRDQKVLDIGTGPYRAPDTLFGDKSYGPAVDMWGAGAMLAECCRNPPRPLFESRPAHEDGSQLGLILSIFKIMGSPTLDTWPEAASFRTPPFEMYQYFEPHSWEDILPDINSGFRDLVAALVKYGSSRANAAQEILLATLHIYQIPAIVCDVYVIDFVGSSPGRFPWTVSSQVTKSTTQ